VAIWLAVGAAITVAFPGLARSIGEGLARREGLSQD
jgi:F0F1-type ATP synthase membrane subunit c/vacuolar-type H+-ATPase subunit K